MKQETYKLLQDALSSADALCKHLAVETGTSDEDLENIVEQMTSEDWSGYGWREDDAPSDDEMDEKHNARVDFSDKARRAIVAIAEARQLLAGLKDEDLNYVDRANTVKEDKDS